MHRLPVIHRLNRLSGNNEIALGASNGRMVRFNENEIRAMGRSSSGVKGMDLDGSQLIGAEVINSGEQILIVTENGYGKKTVIDEYRLTHRGSKGVKALNITEKNGNLVSVKIVHEGKELVIMTNSGMTSWDSSDIKLYNSITGDIKNKKLFYIKEIVDLSNYDNPSDELKSHLENFNKTVKLCKSLGMSVEEVSIDKNLLNAIPSVYVVISCAEATSNMSNLTGISFGPRGEGNSPREIMKDHRTKGFSPLIKRRFVIGSFVLQKENQEKYFINAKRVRRLIVDKMNELFDKYDALILPVGSGPAKYIEGSENNLSSSNSVLEDHLQIGNFGGFPSITIPNGFVNKLPVAVNITGKVKDDINVLNIAYALESKMEYKNQLAKEVE